MLPLFDNGIPPACQKGKQTFSFSFGTSRRAHVFHQIYFLIIFVINYTISCN
jgi:hypothetical protein